ncbi:hypothetical protein ACGFNU_37430 [Spirillospora sp. NPDC048911]
MRLYLSSYRLGERPDRLLGLLRATRWRSLSFMVLRRSGTGSA